MKKLKHIFYFLLAFIPVVIFFELFLSSAGILQQAFTIDVDKGERYRPNKTINTLFTMEGFGITQSNNEGWLKSYTQEINKESLSVGVVGNSFIASRQVFPRNHFLTIAENHYNANSPEQKVSFLNFGKKNMYLGELLFIKEELISKYNTDKIIVFLNERSLGKAKSNQLIPQYKLSNDSLVLDMSFQKSGKLKLYKKLKGLSNSSFLYLVYRVKGKLNDAPKILLDKFYNSKENNDGNIKTIELNDTQKVVLKKLSEDKRVLFMLDLHDANYQNVYPLIKRAPVLDLKPTLEKLKSEGFDPYYWKITEDIGHWNNTGHKVIGEELSNNLNSLIKKN